jgi:transposase
MGDLGEEEERARWLRKLPKSALLQDPIKRLLESYDLACDHEQQTRAQLIRAARREEPVRRFCAVPGFAWIRAVTFYVYVDTPERFAKKSALWRYCGIGLERRHSGSGPTRTQLCIRGNRRLKNVLIGAAKTAIEGHDNPFRDKYRHWHQEEGLGPREARRNVARALTATLWSLWKHQCEYDPQRVNGEA